LSVGAERQRECIAEPGAIRGVDVARSSVSEPATIAGSVAAGEATQAGRSPAETRARRADGSAGSDAEAESNLLPLDPILRPGATTKTGSSSGSEPGRFSTARRVRLPPSGVVSPGLGLKGLDETG